MVASIKVLRAELCVLLNNIAFTVSSNTQSRSAQYGERNHHFAENHRVDDMAHEQINDIQTGPVLHMLS